METAKAARMWGVTVPPESPPMKMGGGKVIRYDSLACFKSSGQPERVPAVGVHYVRGEFVGEHSKRL